MQLVPVDCNALVEEVATTLRPSASAKGLQLLLRLPPQAHVLADRRALQQILINLTNNAIKFTERGLVEMFVERVDDPALGDRVVVGVLDTGIGMSPEELGQLFQAFSQVGNRSQRGNTEGTGLGLYLCRKLAELHGSTIEVSSRSGIGSRFCLGLADADALPDAEPKGLP
jgi:protein-histidine pros-kinase